MAIANRAAAANDLAAAQQAFARTGLTEEQCSMLSLPPAIRRTNVNGGDYPMSAAAMGFEGWVKLEYDIKADGTTTNVRPLVAYPAMIFVDAARSIGKNFKYELTYRPAGANACSASSENLAFKIN
jgi:outer membrane biosynthesis protein TonB